MGRKFFFLGILWASIIFAYLMLGFLMPVYQSMIATTRAGFASTNMTGIWGIDDAVASAPVWLWVIPGLVGIVVSAIWLKVHRQERY